MIIERLGRVERNHTFLSEKGCTGPILFVVLWRSGYTAIDPINCSARNAICDAILNATDDATGDAVGRAVRYTTDFDATNYATGNALCYSTSYSAVDSAGDEMQLTFIGRLNWRKRNLWRGFERERPHGCSCYDGQTCGDGRQRGDQS